MGKTSKKRNLIENVDRSEFLSSSTTSTADWPSRSLYHLMINTKMGDELVIGTILDTMHALESRTFRT